MYKLKYKMLPNKFQSLFKLKIQFIQEVFGGTELIQSQLEIMKLFIAQQSIEYSGVKVWNALPNKIKEIQSKSAFASKLKQYLLS